MKNNICFYLINTNPIFNEHKLNIFPSFTKKYSARFYTALMLNLIETIFKFNQHSKLVLCLNKLDEDYIPTDVSFQNIYKEFHFFNTNNNEIEIHNLFEKNSEEYHNHIFLKSNFVGLLPENLSVFSNLFSIEDDVTIVGRSSNNKICFVGFNSLISSAANLFNFNSQYESYLKKTNKLNGQLYSFSNFRSLENQNDFKLLYKFLSAKDNFNLCSKYIYDKFTNIFIEYKELL